MGKADDASPGAATSGGAAEAHNDASDIPPAQ